MPGFHLVETTVANEAALRHLHQLSQQISIELHGEDQTGTLESLRATSADASSRLNGIVLAVPGMAPASVECGRFGLPPAPDDLGEVWGSMQFTLPLLDNRHLVDNVFVQVAPEYRRGGIATAMVSHLHQVAAAHQRSTILMWSDHRPDATAESWVSAPQGTGAVPLDAASRFAAHLGFRLAQVERQSRLALPVDPELLAALTAHARDAAASDYHLVSWTGPTPPEYLDAVAAANHAISADAPSGEIDCEDERWDATRVQEADERMAAVGTAFHTLAVSTSGQPAGLTTIYIEDGEPQHGYQFNTVVISGHRGHRLGLWMKTTNLAAVIAAFPDLPHLDTWNADENEHMLAINTAMGYRPWALGGGWQLVR
ncbi:MAG: GNAT family N-acetyltransferase [Propionibacteriales bacterium]|nr:GNAT family N-acetyltransferase [Propionibacteriales bacterium]